MIRNEKENAKKMKKKIKRKVKIPNYLQSHGISPTLSQPKSVSIPRPKLNHASPSMHKIRDK
jgi:hypothetical protein